MASFFDEMTQLTKAARTKNVRTEVDKDASVLLKFFEKKIKDLVRAEAELGGSYIVLNLWEFTFDYMSKWSIDQLLYEDLYDGYVPVFDQLFGEGSVFDGFEVLYFDDKNFELIWETDPDANRVEIKQEPVTPKEAVIQQSPEAPGAPFVQKQNPFIGQCEQYACDFYNDAYCNAYYDELNKAISDLYLGMYTKPA